MDRLLKSNTSKTCTHSLFRQGCMLYELIPNMPEHRLRRFAEMLVSSGLLAGFCRDQMRGGVRMPATPHIRETDRNYLTPVNASSRQTVPSLI